MNPIPNTTVLRTVTELDFVRLRKLGGGELPEALDAALAQADLADTHAIAPDIATMNSRLAVTDLPSGRRQTLTLCYPPEAAPAEGRISVLSPKGSALIGLRAGAVAHWRTPQGTDCETRLDAVLYQPEAAGDHLR